MTHNDDLLIGYDIDGFIQGMHTSQIMNIGRERDIKYRKTKAQG